MKFTYQSAKLSLTIYPHISALFTLRHSLNIAFNPTKSEKSKENNLVQIVSIFPLLQDSNNLNFDQI